MAIEGPGPARADAGPDQPAAATAGWSAGWWAGAAHRPSPNEGPRPDGARISLVVVHSISLPPGQYGGPCIEDFFLNRLDSEAHPYFAQLRGLRVSAHFVIRRDGALLQFVSADRRAWHAGRSCWGGRPECNDYSIGIELEGLEGLAFERVQYRRLAGLLAALAARYPLQDVVGHEHVAPGRKADPGPGFDWTLLHFETMALAPWIRPPGHPGLMRPAAPFRP